MLLHRNDETTARALFEQHQRLAHWFAHRYRRKALERRIPFEDLQQSCWLALWKAAQYYNPDCGFRFSTLMHTLAKQALHVLLRHRDRQCREIAVDPQQAAQMDAGSGSPRLEPDTVERLDAALARLDPRTRRIIRDRFGLGRATLTHRTRARQGCCQTLEELGRRHGLTREGIRLIINKGLRQLQHQLRDQGLD
ncbi:MAG: sigma-70 family RNA polymerase sigma factor [Planctomycetia bacterium]|nr:sigma-70 family RNA polymerase sigma factor [Planctomycetia bacterium]